MAEVDRERIAQLAGVLLGEVDLVVGAVECERHRLVCLGTVQIVDKHDVDPLSHGRCPFHSSDCRKKLPGTGESSEA